MEISTFLEKYHPDYYGCDKIAELNDLCLQLEFASPSEEEEAELKQDILKIENELIREAIEHIA